MCAQAAAMMRMDLSKRYLADETNDEKNKNYERILGGMNYEQY